MPGFGEVSPELNHCGVVGHPGDYIDLWGLYGGLQDNMKDLGIFMGPLRDILQVFSMEGGGDDLASKRWNLIYSFNQGIASWYLYHVH